LFGAAAVVSVSVWAILYVGDNLRTLEAHNDSVRDALDTLDKKRDTLADEKAAQGDVLAQITDEPVALATYVEKAGSEAGVQIRAQTEKPPAVKNKFRELALQITLTDVTLEQVAQFLKKIEAQPTVVTQHVDIRRSSLAKEKIDHVEITVATYARTKKEKGKEGGAEAPSDAGSR
jgi:Tfp pilus assembly protein PilO